MHKKLILAFVITFSLAIIPAVKAAHVSCGDTITNDTTLDSNLLNCPTNGIVIGVNDITLDCQGHIISGSGGGSGILAVSRQNITIKNCVVQNFFEGIKFSSTTQSQLVNNIAQNNQGDGFILSLSSNNNLTSNTANNNNFGFHLSSSSNNILASNIANANNGEGFFLVSSSNNTLTFNAANNGIIGNGFSLSSSSNNILISNTANGNKFAGFFLVSSSNNNLTSNVANINRFGFRFESASNNMLTSNAAASNSDHGFFLSGGSSNILTFNFASNNDFGIFLAVSSNNNLTSNTANNNNQGFRLEGASNNILISNTANKNLLGFFLRPSSNNNTLTSNTANNNNVGFLFSFSSNNILTNNTAQDNLVGFSFSHSSNNILKNNKAQKNSGGFFLTRSSNNNIINNTAQNNLVGFELEESSNNTLTSNTADNNDIFGFVLLFSSNFNTLTSNTANNNSDGGFFLIESFNNILTSNIADNGNIGFILTEFSSFNILTSNTAQNNIRDGFRLEGASNNNFISNIANNNSDSGFHIQGIDNILEFNTANNNGEGFTISGFSDSNTIKNNIVINNSFGVHLSDSNANLIVNNFFDNTINAFDDAFNIWNITKTSGTNIISGSFLGGNFWSDYLGNDTDDDGLGDNLLPYNSNGNIQNGGDFAPLVGNVTKITIPSSEVRIFKFGTTPVPGRIVNYFILVQNTGTGTRQDQIVFEILEPWFEFISANPQPINVTISSIFWNISTLAPKETRIFSYKVKLNSSIPIGFPVRGTACTQGGESQDIINKIDLCNNVLYTCFALGTVTCRKSVCLAGPIACSACVVGVVALCNVVHNKCLDNIGVEPNCDEDEDETEEPKDPNEKGVIANKFIQPDQLLIYPIHFENVGTIEALDIFVGDTLDHNLNLSTLEILSPNGTFVPLQQGETIVLLERKKTRTENITFDNITIEINITIIENHTVTLQGRTINWSLLGIELPPNGTGEVFLSVKPLEGLPSGTEIRNNATIQFEIFETITTNEVINIIDDIAPECVMNLLQNEILTPNFTISWNGTDEVGEIDSFTIFVSADGGSFTQFITTTDTSTIFTGEIDRTYEFICISKDTAGNAEIQKAIAETVTLIIPDTDSDGVSDNEDACKNTVGRPEYQGCPVGDENLVELHVIDRAKIFCGGAGSCKVPIENEEVRVFDRNDPDFQANFKKNPSGTLYPAVYEADIGRIGNCITNASGRCIAGEEQIGDYLVIVKFTDPETGKIIYTGKPKSPSDFVDTDSDGIADLASKDFQIIKVIKKDVKMNGYNVVSFSHITY